MNDRTFTLYHLSSAQFDFETGAVPQVQRLLEIHSLIGGEGRGRRRNLEMLNKSAIVLTCAYWEAFVEDLAAETLLHLAKNARSPTDLPTDLKKSVIKELQRSKNELAAWDLADEGWRNCLSGRARRIQGADDQTLSSPTSRKVDDFIRNETGITGLASSWRWSGVGPSKAHERLDRFVKLRNAVSHRGGLSDSSVKKAHAQAGLDLIARIVKCSLTHVNDSIYTLVGTKLISDPVVIPNPLN